MKVYQVFRADTIRTQTPDVDRVYDINIPNFEIAIPDANARLAIANVLTDKQVCALVERDSLKAIAETLALLTKQKYARIVIADHVTTRTPKVAAAMNDLDGKMREIRQLTSEAIQDRRANPDKYATDLSGRFAAMNAFSRRNN
jgi:hypothetical protein